MSVPQASATEKASLFKAGVKNPQRPLKTAEIDIIQAKAEAWLTPLGQRKCQPGGSIFDFTLGVGVTTGGGRVRDDSVTVPGRSLGATVRSENRCQWKL